jgi:hypothetical protein
VGANFYPIPFNTPFRSCFTKINPKKINSGRASKKLSSIRYYSLLVFYISIIKLKKICEFHILAPQGLR